MAFRQSCIVHDTVLTAESAPIHSIDIFFMATASSRGNINWVTITKSKLLLTTPSIMDTMSALLPILHVPQACLSAYTIYLSSIAVPKLQRYEERSEKAAEYSNVAEHQLHKTRTTQTSGAIAVSRLSTPVLL
jgi:hypothetical protein